jgi:hypothetical protein
MFSSDDFPNGKAKCFGEAHTFGLDFCTANPKKALAKGVLRQAAKDLRRFRLANDTVGHGFYIDAYTWVVSDDIAWPYSFVNVCQVLGLSSEITRTGLLVGAESGWYSRSLRTAQKISTLLRDVFITAFQSPFKEESERTNPRASSGAVALPAPSSSI